MEEAPYDLIKSNSEFCARSEYLWRIAFDMPNAKYPTESDNAALNENNPMLWNLIVDLLGGQVTHASHPIKVLQSEPELLLQLSRETDQRRQTKNLKR